MKVSSKLMIAGVVLCAGLVHMASAATIKVEKKDPNMQVWYKVGQGKYKELKKDIKSSKKDDYIYFSRDGGTTDKGFVRLGGKEQAKEYKIVIDEEGKPAIKPTDYLLKKRNQL